MIISLEFFVLCSHIALLWKFPLCFSSLLWSFFSFFSEHYDNLLCWTLLILTILCACFIEWMEIEILLLQTFRVWSQNDRFSCNRKKNLHNQFLLLLNWIIRFHLLNYVQSKAKILWNRFVWVIFSTVVVAVPSNVQLLFFSSLICIFLFFKLAKKIHKKY